MNNHTNTELGSLQRDCVSFYVNVLERQGDCCLVKREMLNKTCDFKFAVPYKKIGGKEDISTKFSSTVVILMLLSITKKM